jgi:trans-aconitate methyltransferase
MKSPQSSSVIWNPADYAAHSGAQTDWGLELVSRLALRGDERALDVGCGDGKITAALACRLPRGWVLGVDSSCEMIAFARAQHAAEAPGRIAFEPGDARHLRAPDGDLFDLVISNATLHWVDDHAAFLRSAAACLQPGGRLVVSCGGKGNAHDVFLALRATLRDSRWRGFFRRLEAPYFFYDTEDYKRWLAQAGFTDARIRLTDEKLEFAGSAGLAAWIRTTWMPYTQRVPADQREQFIGEVVARFEAAHPAQSSGKLPVRIVRLELSAVKTG